MAPFILKQWAQSISTQPYYANHFVVQNPSLAEKFICALITDQIESIAVTPLIIDYTENSPLAARDLLDSIFKLRDVFIESAKKTGQFNFRQQDNFLKNLEETIIKLGTYFTKVRLELNNNYTDKQYVDTGQFEDCILNLDQNFNIHQVNTALLQKFGYTKQELIGKSFFILFSVSSQRLLSYTRDQLSLNLRSLMELDAEAITHDGRKFHVMVKITRMGAKNHPAKYACVIQDITYIHETKSILGLLSLALESVGEGIVIFEPALQGKILYVNQAMEKISGYLRQQLLGKPFSILAGDRLDPALEKEIYDLSLNKGWKGEITNQRHNGEPYSVYLHTQPVKDETGKTVAIVGIERDITEPKKQQQEILHLQQFIEQIINNIQHYIFVTDDCFHIQFWNQSLVKDMNISAREVIGRSLQEIIPELNQVCSSSLVANIVNNKTAYSKKFKLMLIPPEERYYQINITPLSGMEDSKLLLWMIEDIHPEELMKKRITWQNTRLKFLENLAGFLNSTLDVKSIFLTFSNELRQIVAFKSLNVLLSLDINKKYFRQFFTSTPDAEVFPENEVLSCKDIPFHKQLLKKQKIIIFDVKDKKVSQSPLVQKLRSKKVNQIISMPIHFSGNLIGILMIGHEDSGFFVQEELDFFEQVVNHLTVALKNSLHFEQIETQNRKLNLINHIFSLVRENQPVSVLLDTSLKNLLQLSKYNNFAIYQQTNKEHWTLLSSVSKSDTLPNNGKVPQELQFPESLDRSPLIWINGIYETTGNWFFERHFNTIIQNSAFCLTEKTTYYRKIMMVGFSDQYLPDISYTFHIKIFQEILKEIALAIDHTLLLHKTIAAEKKWQTTFDAVNIGLALLGSDSRIQQANKAFWNIFESSTKENPTYQELLDRHQFLRYQSKIHSNNFTENPMVTEWFDPIRQRYFVQRFHPLANEKNGHEAGILTIQDVTEERQKDEHILYLSRFPETNPNLVISLDQNGQVLYYNPAVKRLLQNLNLEEKNLFLLIPDAFKFELQNESFLCNKLHEYKHQIQDKVYQFVAFRPGENENIYLYGMDMTDQLHLQQQLIQTERVRAMGEMAAGVAHDFNNLLATILGRTQLLLLKYENSTLEKELRVIEKAAKDGGQIVKKLQEVSKLKREKSFKPVYLSEIIKDSLLYSAQKLKLNAQVKGKQTHLHIEIDENIVVIGNPIELKEVFTNLIFNAYDAMPNGGDLFIKAYRKEAQMAEIIIRDTGVGIPEKIINKIFNPFFTTKGERGTGLGLSMVYNIVTAHKGTIQVHSKFKKGTEFSICLPTTKRRPTNGDQPRESRNLIFEDVRLLVVDDEVELLDTMAEILKMKFKEVDIAGSGKEAIRRVKKNDYDIVLTDLGMPEMSGWEVAREIKKISQQVKVILVTGWGMQAEEELKHHHYVDKIISKPYELNVLLQTIQSLKQNSTQEATLV